MQTMPDEKIGVKQKNREWRKKLQAANDNLAADLLRGADQIAAFMGFPRRTIYHLVSKGALPHFKLGDIICARRSTLTAFIEKQERAA